MNRSVTLLVWVFLLGIGRVHAQKTDYQWIFGYDNAYYNPNIPVDSNFGGVTMDFNTPTPIATKHIRKADFNEDNISFCDEKGNLLFYSNGGDVFDSRDSIMLNGDSLNYGLQWYEELIFNSGQRFAGLRMIQGMLTLPSPGDSTTAYIIHCIFNTVTVQSGNLVATMDTTFYTLIDLKGNNGFGQVIRKNAVIDNDSLAYGYLSAVKHGNGRDWWIIHPYYNGECYYKFLLTDTGIGLNNVQCLGDSLHGNGDLGTSCFSPDGSKYLWVNSTDGIHIFDFDRCSGVLSNPQKFLSPMLALAIL